MFFSHTGAFLFKSHSKQQKFVPFFTVLVTPNFYIKIFLNTEKIYNFLLPVEILKRISKRNVELDGEWGGGTTRIVKWIN